MTDFSFASLVKPGEGATRALRNHLQARQARDARMKKPHWVYSGLADLLLQHGTFFTGRELDAKWEHLRGPQKQCHTNALAAAESEATLRYFTGLYIIAGEPCSHSWCVDADGALLELTFPGAEERGTNPMAGTIGNARPALTPPHWAYVGVEYSTEFAVAHRGGRGLPILDPHGDNTKLEPGELGCYLHSEELPMWATPYSRDGFPVPPRPTLCQGCLGWGCEDCNDTGAEP